jgi:hypothetical protein
LPYCYLDLSSVPATCETDVCTGKGAGACTGPCTFTANGCQYKELCARQSDGNCIADLGCELVAPGNCQKKVMCDTYNADATKSCSDTVCPLICGSDPACVLVANETAAICAKKPCTTCTAPSATCDYTHSGVFTPGTSPIQVFTTAPAVEDTIEGYTVAIVGGVSVGDRLLFGDTNTAPFKVTWDDAHFTLRLAGNAVAAQAAAALQKVMFTTSSSNNVARTITYTKIVTGSSAVGPVFDSTRNAVIEYVAANQVTYTQAKARCESRSYGSTPGQLVSVPNAAAHSVLLNNLGGKGINAWLGGSGQKQQGTPVWQWEKNSLNSDVQFFKGDYLIGAAQGFANFAPTNPATVPDGLVYFTLMQDTGLWTSQEPIALGATGFYQY